MPRVPISYHPAGYDPTKNQLPPRAVGFGAILVIVGVIIVLIAGGAFYFGFQMGQPPADSPGEIMSAAPNRQVEPRETEVSWSPNASRRTDEPRESSQQAVSFIPSPTVLPAVTDTVLATPTQGFVVRTGIPRTPVREVVQTEAPVFAVRTSIPPAVVPVIVIPTLPAETTIPVEPSLPDPVIPILEVTPDVFETVEATESPTPG